MKRGRKAAIEASGSYDSSSGSVTAMSSQNAEKLQREREARLQKRVSAGGRLAKNPIPER
jgi:Arf-GAP/SH3 domain/ANK repeat/PH domain-containing protein